MTTEEVLDLMYTPIYNAKMLKIMEELEIKVPQLDEQSELDLYVSAGDFNDKGIEFRFEEIDGKSIEGEPLLIKISLNASMNKVLPFNLALDDDYQICCEKIGKKADYYHDFIDDIMCWIYDEPLKGTFLITLTFKDEDLSKLKSIFFIKFNKKNDVDENMIPNEK